MERAGDAVGDAVCALPLLGVHLADAPFIKPDLARIGAHHVLGVAMGGHLREISVLKGADDVRTDVEPTGHGHQIDPLALTGLAQLIPV